MSLASSRRRQKVAKASKPFTGSPTRGAEQQTSSFWGTGYAQDATQNPYSGYAANVQRYRGKLDPYVARAASMALNPYGRAKSKSKSKSKSKGKGARSWGSAGPGPNDPRVQGYMEHILGGQRAMMDDYAKRAYARNLRGQRTAGGGNPQAALHSQALQHAARGYADRYDQAMGYATDAAGREYDAWNSAADRAANLAGQLYGYQLQSFNPELASRQSQDKRSRDILSMQRADYLDDVGWNRGKDQRERDYRLYRWYMDDLRRERRRADTRNQAGRPVVVRSGSAGRGGSARRSRPKTNAYVRTRSID